MNKIEEIRARVKRRKELEVEGKNEEEIKGILTREGYYPVKTEVEEEETPDNKEITTNLNENTVKVWCHQCKTKVCPLNSEIKTIEIKKGSNRNILTGKCPDCNRKVSGLVKNSVCRPILEQKPA